MNGLYMNNLEEIKQYASTLYKLFYPYCIAIYLGGSRVNPYIKNPGDIDLILFTKNHNDKFKLNRMVAGYLKKKYDKTPIKNKDGIYDLIQIRNKEKEEHSYGSFINKQMIHLVGENINFEFDIIDKDKEEYIKIIKEAPSKFHDNKRYYQLYYGLCIMKNRSYELNEKQIYILNVLHDKTDDYLNYIENIKIEINKL